MRRTAALPLLLLVPACALPFPGYRLTAEPTTTLPERFAGKPAGTRMTLRAILEYGGMEIGMTFRIWRLLPDSFRAIVTDDLGGALLHVVRRGDGLTVVARAKALPEALVRALGEDLAAWLLAGGDPGDRVVTLTDGTPALLRERDSRRGLYFASDDRQAGGRSPDTGSPVGDGLIDRILVGTGDSLDTTIEVDWQRDARAHPRPRRVRLRNHRFGYAADLELREWQPADLTPSKFGTGS